MGTVLAIDIGGTKIAVGVVEGEALRHHTILAMDRGASALDILDRVAEVAAGWMGDVEGVAVASTGRVQDGRVHAVNRGTLPRWEGVPVAEALRLRLSRPVTVLNDAHAMAFAEWRLGAGRGADPFAFVTVSTGIGAGIVAGGRLWVGAHGVAAHLGHVTFEPDGPACGCGQRGCLERLASGRALDAFARERYGEGASARTLFQRAAGGDEAASAALQRAAERVALGVRAVHALVDPELIVVGGSVGLADGFLERVQRSLQDVPEPFRPTVASSRLGMTAGMLGAALVASTASVGSG